jgi:hypothetical protein
MQAGTLSGETEHICMELAGVFSQQLQGLADARNRQLLRPTN